jgi:general secretion pathway protein A
MQRNGEENGGWKILLTEDETSYIQYPSCFLVDGFECPIPCKAPYRPTKPGKVKIARLARAFSGPITLRSSGQPKRSSEGNSRLSILPNGRKMVKDFYGFAEEPFAFTPHPRFLFMTEGHREVLNSLASAIRERKGFILLTGERGIGKTTLVQQLVQMFEPAIKAVPLYQPSDSFPELLENILRQLNLSLDERDRGSMVSRLNDYLHQISARDETLALIVDEAQDLSKKTMEELRLLCNSDPRRPRFLQEILVGSPEIADKLNSVDLRQLSQRITIRCQLKPLTEEESRQYIVHRLNQAGRSADEVCTPEAISLICRHGKGIPRIINIICYLALAAGYAFSKKKIDGALVGEVLPLLDRQKPSRRQRMKTGLDAFVEDLEKAPLIMKISYTLLAYSLGAAIISYFLSLD